MITEESLNDRYRDYKFKISGDILIVRKNNKYVDIPFKEKEKQMDIKFYYKLCLAPAFHALENRK